MTDAPTSTLLSTERRLRPLVLAVTLAVCALVAVMLGWSLPRTPLPLWLPCCAASLALEATNLNYLRTHALTTVGMIPVALFSLIPADVACLCSVGSPPPLRIVLVMVLAALSAILVVFALWFLRLRRAYAAQPPVASDACLVVLGGAIRKGGRPCRTLARRLDVAARLWREQPTRTLVVTGGPTPDGTITEADAMASYLQEAGVTDQSILRERTARNTRENLTRSLALLEEHGLTGQRCVVSSDYHLWRARREARALGTELVAIASPTPPPSVLQQWCREVLTILSGG